MRIIRDMRIVVLRRDNASPCDVDARCAILAVTFFTFTSYFRFRYEYVRIKTSEAGDSKTTKQGKMRTVPMPDARPELNRKCPEVVVLAL